MSRKRNINFEIIKIIAMIFIISGHLFTHTKLLTLNELSPVGILGIIYKPIFVLGVNIFVLITGYFQCEALFKKSKLLRLWKNVLIWSILCTVVGAGLQV